MGTRTWWNRYGSQLALLSLAVFTALWVRQTQGAALFEVYYWITRPFQIQSEQRLEQQQQAESLNPIIQGLEARVEELEQQNKRLGELVDYVSTRPNFKGVVAPVIARSPDHWWQQITLGRGSQAGVKENALVMGPGGLVGRIISVTPNTSKVLLVTDPTSRIGVAVARSRQMGYLQGLNNNQGVLAFFNTVPDVQPGDVVTTSVFSQILPPGWPVGKVVSVDINKATGPEAAIAFFAPLDSLEWVVVYPNEQQSSAVNNSSPTE
ncbi:MAG: rod shape-determining protein MreC [Arthrospira sp. PLM2.Bin9]|nr:rod shape-determining protein MreC [Arthrospira sp. PLM2.Bin9]TVU54539.1 MAG: rod shape-determining protein MreC [Arthrospira sp. PLM2.Bin9]